MRRFRVYGEGNTAGPWPDPRTYMGQWVRAGVRAEQALEARDRLGAAHQARVAALALVMDARSRCN